jgi:hypothetical protein
LSRVRIGAPPLEKTWMEASHGSSGQFASPRRLSENKPLEQIVPNWIRRNLKNPEAKFKTD